MSTTIPYLMGDVVAVRTRPVFESEDVWVTGVVTVDAVRAIGLVEGRWALKIAVGLVGNAPLEARVYCDDEGVSDTLRPFDESAP